MAIKIKKTYLEKRFDQYEKQHGYEALRQEKDKALTLTIEHFNRYFLYDKPIVFKQYACETQVQILESLAQRSEQKENIDLAGAIRKMYEIASRTQIIPNYDPWNEVAKKIDSIYQEPDKGQVIEYTFFRRVEFSSRAPMLRDQELLTKSCNDLSDKFTKQMEEHYAAQALKPKSISSKLANHAKKLVEGAIKRSMIKKKGMEGLPTLPEDRKPKKKMVGFLKG